MHITISRTLLLLLVAGITPSCDESFEPHCHRDEDCRPGETCDLATNQCSTSDVDAGDAGPDAGDAEPDAADATPCTGHSSCTEDEAPLCLSEICQPCTSDPTECAVKDSTRPVCEGGQCVECNNTSSPCTSETAAVCNAGTCVPCQNGSTECEAAFPLLPECLNNECVQCITSVDDCGGATPVCDLTTNACRQCEAHSECDFLTGADRGICDWDTRTCVAEADIIYVDVNGACNSGGTGTALIPFCQIHEAWAEVAGTRNTILVAAGDYQPISVNNANLPRILTRAGAAITFTNTQSIIEVSGATTELLVEGFVIHAASGANHFGVECFNSASVTLLNNEIHNNTAGGVNASNCFLTMDSNVVHTNNGGGILVLNSDFTITNNIVHSNGVSQASWGGVNIVLPGSTQVFAHNTVVDNNTSGAGIDAGILCGGAVDIVNSINYDNEGHGQGANLCNFISCWQGTTANLDPNPDLDPTTRKLNSGSGCIGFSPAYSGVTFDIDGEARDAVNADTGADEYYP